MHPLFICRENVGRSQVAEALYNKIAAEKGLGSENLATSAGTHANTYEHFGKPLRELVQQVLAEHGIDASTKISKQLTPESVKNADKIIMLAEPDLLPEWLTGDPDLNAKLEFWQVADMKGQDMEFHRKVAKEIEGKVREMLG